MLILICFIIDLNKFSVHKHAKLSTIEVASENESTEVQTLRVIRIQL